MADLARPARATLAAFPRQRREAPAAEPRRSPHRQPWLVDSYMLAPLALFALILVAGAILPLPSATAQSLPDRLLPPIGLGGGWAHPLGTDGLGRDVLSRIASGAWVSLRISLIAGSIAAVIGVSFGIASGAIGGWVEHLLTLLAEVTLILPSIVIGVVLTATLGQSMQNLVVILVMSGWISYARVLRLETRRLVRSDFVLAAVATGAGRWRISLRHILPNLLPSLLVLYCQQLGGMMLWEASLTYLGLGARPDTISLGGIVRDGQTQIFNGWWISVASGVTVALAIVGFALAGDWLRDRLDHGEGRAGG